MDFKSAMETFAEAWVAANAGQQTQALALTRPKSPPILLKKERSPSPHCAREIERNSQDLASPRRYRQLGNSPPMINDHNRNVNSSSNSSNCSNSSNNTNSSNNNCVSNNSNNLSTSSNLPQQQQQIPTTGAVAVAVAAAATASMANSLNALPKPGAIGTVSSSLTENSSGNGIPSGATVSSSGLAQSLDRKEFEFSKANAKSLPLHCVVESVPSIQASLTIDTRNMWKRRPNIEADSYVIIASSTPWSDVVTTALQRLGYSIDIASTARGSLIIKNWKPIPVENISDSPGIPVCDILGELTSIVTLRIVILRTKPTTFAEIKDKLLKLLVLQSHAVLRSTGCPLDEVMLSQICRSSYQNSFPFTGEISEELRRKFDQWWSSQLTPQSPIATPKILPFIAPQQNDLVDFSNTAHPLHRGQEAATAAAAAAAILENHHHHHHHGHHPGHPNLMVHPALHTIHSQYPNQKTRMRTSFDPEMELPKLQRWFQENPHPSRQQIQSYVIQLNSLESRRGRKPLDVNNVVYWFKNARAAQKRAEMRVQGLGNGYVNNQQANLMMNHGDYIKSPHSMKSEDIDNLSQHSDDIDDDNNSSRPSSPQLPLSLTTHERNRALLDENVIKIEDLNGRENEKVTNNNNNFHNRSNNNHSNGNNNGSPVIPQDITNGGDVGNDGENVDMDLITNHGDDDDDEEDNSKLNKSASRNVEEANDFVSSNNNSNCNNDGNPSDGCTDLTEEQTNHNNQPQQQHPRHQPQHQQPENRQQQLQNQQEMHQLRSTNSSRNSQKSDDELDMDENDVNSMDDFGASSLDLKRELLFPAVPNSMFSAHSIMYMSHYMPGLSGQPGAGHHPHHTTPANLPPSSLTGSGLNLSNLSNEERRKRNRTFIDPVTEVPKLEQWFAMNTHPSHNLILKYTEDLNRMPYRQKFPRLESKNVQFWFKNRRAKCKRLKMSLYDNPQCPQLGMNAFGHTPKYEDPESKLSLQKVFAENSFTSQYIINSGDVSPSGKF